MKFALVALLLAMVGCKPSQKKVEDTAPAGVISASPNPVPSGKDIGTTKVSWTGDGSFREVYVSVDNAAENRCWGSADATGSFDFPYINAGAVYEFRLYRGSDHKELLGSIKVTRETE